MQYKVVTITQFSKWLSSMKDKIAAQRIVKRIERVQHLGHFGDVRELGGELAEMRFFFGAGYRVYYSIQGAQVVFLLWGGDKSSQPKDIEKARQLLIAVKAQLNEE